jgi:hypothetical protein
MKRLIGRLAENDEINRILSRQDEILPSSGFAASVMDTVRREAAAPPPIPFPWKRALPGLVVGGFVLALALVWGTAAIAQLARGGTTQHLPMSVPPLLPPIFHGHGGVESAAIWTALALLMALISVRFSMRLASARV